MNACQRLLMTRLRAGWHSSDMIDHAQASAFLGSAATPQSVVIPFSDTDLCLKTDTTQFAPRRSGLLFHHSMIAFRETSHKVDVCVLMDVARVRQPFESVMPEDTRFESLVATCPEC